MRARETPQISGQPAINLAKYKKSVFSILYIVLLFYISYAPFIVFFGIYRSLRDHSVVELAYVMSLTFMFLSSSLNPLIYIWKMNHVRKKRDEIIVQVIGSAFQCLPS